MGTNYNPQIVTSGLVLCVDAANPKSYPGSGNTWIDLSNSKVVASLNNSPTFNNTNKSITFNGTDQFANVFFTTTLTEATFIVWLRRNGTQPSYAGLFFSRFGGGNVTGIGFSNSDLLSYTWNDAFSTYNWNSGLTIPDLEWCMCGITVSSSSATGYLCRSTNISSNTNSTSHTSTSIANLNIARDFFSNRFFNGEISNVQLYNRALSNNEILQNFNATRGRYNL